MQFTDDMNYWGGYKPQQNLMPQGQTQVPTGPAAPPVPTGTVPTPAGAGQDFVAPFSYSTPAYTGPMAPHYNLPGVPKFSAPDFKAPDANSIYSDPGYQFRLKQGQGALDASAAATGNLKTGGHLKDFDKYTQDLASQEYGNVYARALQDYDRDYKAKYDQFAPLLQDYNNRFNANVNAGNQAFQWNTDLFKYNQDDEFRREAMLAQLGIPT